MSFVVNLNGKKSIKTTATNTGKQQIRVYNYEVLFYKMHYNATLFKGLKHL